MFVAFFKFVLLVALIICAMAACLTNNLLFSVTIFMSYSVMMSIIWILLESPDLAITEAAVGAGITTILFFVTLKRLRHILREENEEDE